MALFSTLYDWVMPELPGCDIPIINFHIRKQAREFLRRTTLWREDVTITLVAGQALYPIVPIVPGVNPSDADTDVGVPLGVLTVCVNNQPINPLTEQTRPADGVLIQPCQPNAWFQFTPDYIQFYPTPDNAATYTAIVQIYKTIPLTSTDLVMPDALYSHYMEILANGVKASLMGMAKKPWSNQELALVYNRMFADGVLSTRDKYRSGGQRSATRITFPAFGHGAYGKRY